MEELTGEKGRKEGRSRGEESGAAMMGKKVRMSKEWRGCLNKVTFTLTGISHGFPRGFRSNLGDLGEKENEVDYNVMKKWE